MKKTRIEDIMTTLAPGWHCVHDTPVNPYWVLIAGGRFAALSYGDDMPDEHSPRADNSAELENVRDFLEEHRAPFVNSEREITTTRLDFGDGWKRYPKRVKGKSLHFWIEGGFVTGFFFNLGLIGKSVDAVPYKFHEVTGLSRLTLINAALDFVHRYAAEEDPNKTKAIPGRLSRVEVEGESVGQFVDDDVIADAVEQSRQMCPVHNKPIEHPIPAPDLREVKHGLAAGEVHATHAVNAFKLAQHRNAVAAWAESYAAIHVMCTRGAIRRKVRADLDSMTWRCECKRHLGK